MTKKPEKVLIGAHCSAAGGVHNALLEGKEIGATAIQLFTSNQRQWKGRTLSDDQIQKWNETLEETGITDIMSHDSYLINLGSPKDEVLEKSRATFENEIIRCQQLGISYLNFHPGAALKEPVEQCLNKIVESLLLFEKLVSQGETLLVLETTAGQGSNVGWKFEELRYIIDGVKDKMPIGVCVDTCHIFAAGYDLQTKEACDETLKKFDQVIGLEYLKAFHLNDSMKELGSRVDRHRPLGEGFIGIDCFEFLMQDERTKDLPKYLETPGGPENWKKEIAKLKEYANKN